MNSHTPGPWHVGIRPGPIVYGQQGEQVANLHVPMVGDDENKANARLIAAAPELLAALDALLSERYACESIIRDYEDKPDMLDDEGRWTCDSPASESARAAIAKARGKAMG